MTSKGEKTIMTVQVTVEAEAFEETLWWEKGRRDIDTLEATIIEWDREARAPNREVIHRITMEESMAWFDRFHKRRA